MTQENLHIRKVPTSEVPQKLLLLADPSEKNIQTYLPFSECGIAEIHNEVVGVYVLKNVVPSGVELMNIAVKPTHQGQGIGTALLRHAITTAKNKAAKRMEVGTGTFGYQLAFYQKAGFRVSAIERDYFLIRYDEPLFEAGIQHKDRLRLTLDFNDL